MVLVLLMGIGPGLVALTTLAVVYLLLNAAINGAGHTFGSKSFENDATNLKLLALITFGEGYNNHHARPAAPRFSAFRGEFDPAWPVIRLRSSGWPRSSPRWTRAGRTIAAASPRRPL